MCVDPKWTVCLAKAAQGRWCDGHEYASEKLQKRLLELSQTDVLPIATITCISEHFLIPLVSCHAMRAVQQEFDHVRAMTSK